MVFLAIPILAILMMGVKRYYRDVEHEIAIDDTTHFGSEGDVAIILVNRLQKPVIKAIDYAIAAKHQKTIALHVAANPEDGVQLQKDWQQHRIPIPLVIVESPFRHYAAPRRGLHQQVPRQARPRGGDRVPAAVHRGGTGGSRSCTTGVRVAWRAS